MPPSGVTLLLTSRHERALPLALRRALDAEPGRHIFLSGLNERQVSDFLQQRGIRLPAQDLQSALRVSGGIPIYLEYLAEQLGPLDKYAQRHLLSSAVPLEGQGIDRFHEDLWASVGNNPLNQLILAVLARRQEF